jgi:hypothetical protein
MVFLAIMLVVGISFWWYGHSQYENGVKEIQMLWDADRNRTALRNAEERAKRIEENAAQAEQYKKDLAEQKRKYETEIASARRYFDEHRNDGLRITAYVCPSGRTASTAEACGTENESPAGTASLPKEVERNLRELMLEADKVTEMCRMAQDFIMKNGFGEK